MLPNLPDKIQIILKDAQLRFSQDLFSAFKESPFPIFKGDKLITKDQFEVYWHIEFDQIRHIERMLSESTIHMKVPVAIYLSKGPVYLVDSPISTEQIALLAKCLTGSCVDQVLVIDQSQGVIIDSYCGYLPDERTTNQEEVVYEFTYYQDSAQGNVLDTLARANNLIPIPPLKPNH